MANTQAENPPSPPPQIQILEISREKEGVALAFDKSTTIPLNNSPAPPLLLLLLLYHILWGSWNPVSRFLEEEREGRARDMTAYIDTGLSTWRPCRLKNPRVAGREARAGGVHHPRASSDVESGRLRLILIELCACRPFPRHRVRASFLSREDGRESARYVCVVHASRPAILVRQWSTNQSRLIWAPGCPGWSCCSVRMPTFFSSLLVSSFIIIFTGRHRSRIYFELVDKS